MIFVRGTGMDVGFMWTCMFDLASDHFVVVSDVRVCVRFLEEDD